MHPPCTECAQLSWRIGLCRHSSPLLCATWNRLKQICFCFDWQNYRHENYNTEIFTFLAYIRSRSRKDDMRYTRMPNITEISILHKWHVFLGVCFPVLLVSDFVILVGRKVSWCLISSATKSSRFRETKHRGIILDESHCITHNFEGISIVGFATLRLMFSLVNCLLAN